MNKNSFRVDRMATLHVSCPLRRILNKWRESAVPVLMYHSISDPYDRHLHPYFETCTSSRVFEEQMKYLSENGYSSIGLNELPNAVKNGDRASRSVVLTFDDGYLDFRENALPILEKYGFKATVFLAAGLMGKKRSVLMGKEIMAWSDAKQLQNQTIVFGSHTVNHLKLVKLSLDEVEVEIGGSKNEIEEKLGKSVDYFSYPYAFPEGEIDYLKNIFMILNKYQYKAGVTTVIGRVHVSDNILALKRIPVNDYDDPALFKAKLDGNYDWVHLPQYLKKKYFKRFGK